MMNYRYRIVIECETDTPSPEQLIQLHQTVWQTVMDLGHNHYEVVAHKVEKIPPGVWVKEERQSMSNK